MDAIAKAGLTPGKDVALALDVAATELFEGGSYKFEGAKKSADEMATYATSLKREYLTPMEDEATRQILVTYWQLRNALLEMVNELRVRGARDRRKYDELFLPGYAGALVLVDAARFLRDRFHHWPLVRRKLNEAEPSFGIPAGVYDATQQSWTQPRHVWELFDAAKYYQKHRHQLVAMLLVVFRCIKQFTNMTWLCPRLLRRVVHASRNP
ncbi:MAG: hypothetical protein ACKN9U_14155, partial [Pirellulaceae bacterium]